MDKFLWEKKEGSTLELWPNESTERYLSKPYLPVKFVNFGKSNKIYAPKRLPFDILDARGIVHAAITSHATNFYSERVKKDFSTIIYTIGGKAELRAGKQIFEINKGDVWLAAVNSTYTLRVKSRWNVIWFNLKNTKNWNQAIGKELVVKKSQFLDELKNAVEMYVKSVYSEVRVIEMLEAYADLIACCIRKEFERVQLCPKLDSFLTEFAANPSMSIDTKSLAKKLDMSLYELDKMCLRSRSEKFAQLVFAIRMKTARQLLSAANVDISDIAIRTGYANRTAFSKAFRRFHDMTPVEFKKSSAVKSINDSSGADR